MSAALRCQHYAGSRRCKADAEFQVLDPDGVARCKYCRTHGRAVCLEYEEVLGELWTLRPIEAVT